MPKSRAKKTEETPEKEVLVGYFWEGGGQSGFVGRMSTSGPSQEDRVRAQGLAWSWREIARMRGRG